MVLNSQDGNPNRLPVNRKFFFRVMKARKSIAEDISHKIRSFLITGRRQQQEKDKGRGLVDEYENGGTVVPFSIVDDVIRKDYMESEMTQTHTIYLLNPRLPTSFLSPK